MDDRAVDLPPSLRVLVAAYQACDPREAEALLYVLMRNRGPTMMLPPLGELMDEARDWASSASIPELEAYGLAAIEALDDSPSSRRLRIQRFVRARAALQPEDIAAIREGLGDQIEGLAGS